MTRGDKRNKREYERKLKGQGGAGRGAEVMRGGGAGPVKGRGAGGVREGVARGGGGQEAHRGEEGGGAPINSR